MTSNNTIVIDEPSKGIVKWGGFALLISGIIAILFFVSVVVSGQTLPAPAMEVLEKPLRPSILFALAVIGEVLLLPGGLGLYFALKNIDKTRMIIATVLWSLCVPMFVASRGQIFAIGQLSSRYLNSANETLKLGYLAAAELALETQNLYAMIGLILLSIASIIMATVMAKEMHILGKKISYVVVSAGVFTIIGATSLMFNFPVILPVIGVILSAIWQTTVGYKLYKLGNT